MDSFPALAYTVHELVARNETSNSTSTTTSSTSSERPPIYKVIGLCLAIASGLFIGTSFVLKKHGLLRANNKYNEEAGEGYGYLKDFYWWCGMTLMIIGEICNFVAYAFVDAILVTPLGALSVVVTTILSAIFLKERLSFVGKVGCFNCIIGSVVIVMNAPEQSAVANIQGMKHFVIAPGFLSYTGVVLLGSAFVAFWVGPRYGKKSMFVYLSICSFIGGLSVVATQGLGAAIVAEAREGHQFSNWFLYVLLVFVVCTLLTEIIYLNKALNLFNAALVTPTYYVFFTSTTILTSAILFRGFHGTPISIVTVIMGFLQICAGVVLLQLSKSAKDVPDAAIFKGDLDQVRQVAEQEQPETEPKADAIRGTAAIIRRFSTVRRNMEMEEAKRLREEKLADHLEPLGENEVVEWDGLRRRKTIIGTGPTMSPSVRRKTIHPPLGMSHFPDDDNDHEDRWRVDSPGIFENWRNRAQSVISPHSHLHSPRHADSDPTATMRHSSLHPVALTDIKVYPSKIDSPMPPYDPGSFEEAQEHTFGGPAGTKRKPLFSPRSKPLPPNPSPSPGLLPSEGARRQFSFTNLIGGRTSRQSTTDSHIIPPTRPGVTSRGSATSHDQRRAMKNATEEERLGLVQGDSNHPLLDNTPDRAHEPLYPIKSVSPSRLHPSSSEQRQYITHHRSDSPDQIADPDDDEWQMTSPPPLPNPNSQGPSPMTSIAQLRSSSRRRPSPPAVYHPPPPPPIPQGHSRSNNNSISSENQALLDPRRGRASSGKSSSARSPGQSRSTDPPAATVSGRFPTSSMTRNESSIQADEVDQGYDDEPERGRTGDSSGQQESSSGSNSKERFAQKSAREREERRLRAAGRRQSWKDGSG